MSLVVGAAGKMYAYKKREGRNWVVKEENEEKKENNGRGINGGGMRESEETAVA